jgi:hypothetical protein
MALEIPSSRYQRRPFLGGLTAFICAQVRFYQTHSIPERLPISNSISLDGQKNWNRVLECLSIRVRALTPLRSIVEER